MKGSIIIENTKFFNARPVKVNAKKSCLMNQIKLPPKIGWQIYDKTINAIPRTCWWFFTAADQQP